MSIGRHYDSLAWDVRAGDTSRHPDGALESRMGDFATPGVRSSRAEVPGFGGESERLKGERADSLGGQCSIGYGNRDRSSGERIGAFRRE